MRKDTKKATAATHVRGLTFFALPAAQATTTEVMKPRPRPGEMEEVKVQMRRDFFDDLLSGNIESLSAIRSLAELHGIKPDIPYRCLLVRYAREEAGGSGQPASKLDTNAELCAELCTRTAKSLGAPVIAIPHSVHVVLLFGVPGQDREDNIRQYTEEPHEALSAHFSPGNLLIVVSGVVENITRIAEAYRDVQSLSRVLRGTGPLGSPVFVEDYSVFYLLEKYVDRQDLADFAQKALGELMAYDSENHSHLLQTLDVYFSRSGSITEVAKQMYIHLKEQLSSKGKTFYFLTRFRKSWLGKGCQFHLFGF